MESSTNFQTNTLETIKREKHGQTERQGGQKEGKIDRKGETDGGERPKQALYAGQILQSTSILCTYQEQMTCNDSQPEEQRQYKKNSVQFMTINKDRM